VIGNRAIAILLGIALPGASLAGAGTTAPAAGTLLVLPVQDRSGDPAIARLVEQAFVGELGGRRSVVAGGTVRDVARTMRLRDPRRAPPSALQRLIDATGADAVLALTILRAERGAPPRLALSAFELRSTGLEVSWAGFESATGLDDKRPLGLGRIDRLEELAERAARRLARRCADRSPGRPAAPLRGELAVQVVDERMAALEQGPLAVVPFDAIDADDASLAAEIATDAAVTALWRAGRRVIWPGAVREILLQRGRLARGGLAPLDRAALRAALSPGVLVTGTVERFVETGQADALRPRVAVSLRVIAADDGRLVAIGGIDADGHAHPGAFGRRTIHGLETLLLRAQSELVTRLLPARRHAGRAP